MAVATIIATALFEIGVPATAFMAGVAIAAGVAVVGGAVIGLGLVAQALSPKPKLPDISSFVSRVQGITTMVRSSIQPHQIIYGERMVSGPLVAVFSTGNSNEYLHLVVALAGHECQEIGDVYLGDLLSTDARFTGLVRVNKHLGADAQTADSDLVSEVTEWTTNHRLRGIAYVYLRLKWDADVWLNGIPNIRAMMKGRKVYDPRTSTTYWSRNAALDQRDYLRASFGVNAATAEVDDVASQAAANLADEYVTTTDTARAFTADAGTDLCTLADGAFAFGDRVQVSTTDTLPGGLSAATNYYVVSVGKTTLKLATSLANAYAGTTIDITTAGIGTHTMTRKAQLRYTTDGAFNLEQRPLDIMEDLLSASAGTMIYTQGVYRLFGGAYDSPTVTLNEHDLRGPIALTSKPSRRELFNAIRGIFVDGENHYQAADFPPITNATYATEDGATLYRDIELPFTTDGFRAQRLGKIALERSRQAITVTFPAKLTAISLSAWDTVQLTIAQFGWTTKVFRVLSWGLAEDGGIDMVLQEETSAAYTWSAEETIIDTAANTTLPNPWSVATPTGLAITTENQTTTDGTILHRWKLTWDAHTDQYVASGGWIEIQHKKSADPTYSPSFWVPGDQSTAWVGPLQDNVAYDVRIRAVSQINVKSAWATIADTLAKDTTAPAAPAGLTATGYPGYIDLDWTDSTEADLSEYGVYRHTANDPGAATEIAEVRASRFIDASVTAGTPYWYWITAYDRSENESAKSTAASATAATAPSGNAPSDPAAPTINTSGTYVATDGRVSAYAVINTPAMPSGGAYLNVLYRINGQTVWQVADQTATGSGTSRIDDLIPGQVYQFAVQAFSGGGGASSIVLMVATHTAGSDSAAPATPTGLAAAVGTGKAVSLDWADNTEADLGEYGVYRHTADVPGSATKIAEVRASRFVDAEVALGTQYFYWVTAIDRSENESAKTASVTATPITVDPGSVDPTAPSQPAAFAKVAEGTYLSGEGTAFAYMDFTLPAMPSGGVLLNLVYKAIAATPYLIAAQSDAGAVTLRIDDLTPGRQYDVACQAVSRFGTLSTLRVATSSPFTAAGDTTAPAVPTSVTVTAGFQSLKLAWTNPADADLDLIEVWRSGTNDSATASIVAEVRGTAYPDTKLANATAYYYWLKAKDKTGNASGFHATQYAGATGTTLRAVTDDVDDDAITQIISDATDASQSFDTTETEVASVTITTVGGAVLLSGKIIGLHTEGGNRTIGLRIRRGADATGTLLDWSMALTGSGRITIPCQVVDSQAAGSYTYKLWADLSAGNTGAATYRRLQAVELKK